MKVYNKDFSTNFISSSGLTGADEHTEEIFNRCSGEVITLFLHGTYMRRTKNGEWKTCLFNKWLLDSVDEMW